MTSPITRILLRYVAMALVMKGLLPEKAGTQLATDPDALAILEAVVGFGVMITTEVWYWAANKFGWKK